MRTRQGIAVALVTALAAGGIGATVAQAAPKIDIDDVPTRTSKRKVKAVPGQIVVGFKKAPTKVESAGFKKLGLQALSYSPALKAGLVAVPRGSRLTASQLMGRITDISKNIDYVELNVTGKVATTPTTPNDPLFANQWYLDKINVPEAYTATNAFAQPRAANARTRSGRGFFQSGLQQSKGVSDAWSKTSMFDVPCDPKCDYAKREAEIAAAIASGDVGAIIEHCVKKDYPLSPEEYPYYPLKGERCVEGDTPRARVVQGGTDPLVTPATKHALNTAAVGSANTNEGLGMASVCPFCSVARVRFLNLDGSTSAWNLAMAINAAVAQDFKVFDVGVALDSPAQVLADAVARAKANDLFLSCPAGNSGSTRITYPAGYDGCYAVGSSDINDQRAATSNFGSWVHIQAPGQGLLTLDPDGQYRNVSGTSMASGLVSATAAMMAINRRLNAEQIRANLGYAAQPTPGSVYGSSSYQAYPTSIHGRLDTFRAIGPTEPPVYSQQVASTDVRNGGFESLTNGRAAPWSEHSAGGFPLISNRRPLQGKFSAFLGGYNLADDWIWQDFTTKGSGKVTVRFALDSRLAKADSDRLDVNLVKHGGARTTFKLSQLKREADGQYSIFLDTRESGTMWRLEFHAVTDGADPALFFVDQVAVVQY